MNGDRLETLNGAIHFQLGRVLRYAWICCFWVVLCLSMLTLPVFPVAPELDLSWTGALPYFAERGLDFGTDVIFTYGPIGHLTGYAYTEYFSTARTVWEFMVKGLAAALFCWALCELHVVIRVTLAVSILLFLGTSEEGYSLIIVVAALLLLRSVRQRPCIHALFGLFLAVVALVKFTYLLQSTCAIGAVIGYCIVRKRRQALTSLVASFCIGLLLCWKLAGQGIASFIPYLNNSLAITAGYNAGMFTPTSNPIVLGIALLLAILLLTQLALFWFREDKARLIFGSIFLMVMLFFLWKHAFTRWENHAPKFFFLFPELLFASWLLSKNNSRPDRLSLALLCIAFVCSFFGVVKSQGGTPWDVFRRPRDQFGFACSILTDYERFDLLRRTRLLEAKRKFDLPQIRAAVGDRTVDVFGYRQGIALLNRLNYVPRPIFQGYSADTPSLIALNTKHYQSINRPEFVISKFETIDDRFPTLDDSKVLLEMLYHYRPILSEDGWQLWQAVRPTNTLTPVPLVTFTAKLGQDVPIPEDSPIWVELELKQTRWGRVKAFFYKTAPVIIELGDDSEQRFRYRIVPSMASSGWLLNPKLTDDNQLVLAAQGTSLPRYTWFRISAGDGCFKDSLKIKFSTLPVFSRRP